MQHNSCSYLIEMLLLFKALDWIACKLYAKAIITVLLPKKNDFYININLNTKKFVYSLRKFISIKSPLYTFILYRIGAVKVNFKHKKSTPNDIPFLCVFDKLMF